MTTRFRALLVVATLFVFQISVFSEVRLRGVSPDVLLLLAVLVGFHGGAARGALVGFVGGLLYDIYLPTPLGMSALVYTVIAFGVGSIQEVLQRSTWQANLAGIASASALGMGLYSFAGELLGQGTFPGMGIIRTLVWGAVYALMLAPAVNRGALWIVESVDNSRPVGRLSVVE